MVKYKYGKKVRIKQYKERPSGWNNLGKMDEWIGQIVTMVDNGRIKEDNGKWAWSEYDFEEIDVIHFLNDEEFKI